MKTISTYSIAAVALALLATAAPAKADPIPGWYIGAGVGATMPTDSDQAVGNRDNKIDFDTGWGVMGDLGYGFNNGFRAEGELAEFRANADKVNGNGGINGRINNVDLMANLYYDFSTGTRWTPYVGAGIGLDAVDADHIGTLTNGGTLNDSDRIRLSGHRRRRLRNRRPLVGHCRLPLHRHHRSEPQDNSRRQPSRRLRQRLKQHYPERALHDACTGKAGSCASGSGCSNTCSAAASSARAAGPAAARAGTAELYGVLRLRQVGPYG